MGALVKGHYKHIDGKTLGIILGSVFGGIVLLFILFISCSVCISLCKEDNGNRHVRRKREQWDREAAAAETKRNERGQASTSAGDEAQTQLLPNDGPSTSPRHSVELQTAPPPLYHVDPTQSRSVDNISSNKVQSGSGQDPYQLPIYNNPLPSLETRSSQTDVSATEQITTSAPRR